MHLHPTVARLIGEIGRDYGMRAMRLPAEPRPPLRRAFPGERLRSPPPGFAVAALRWRLRRARIACNDHVFGIAWSGAMTEDRILALLSHLPEGISEIYFHPAAEMTPVLREAMPGYRPTEELAALVSPRVRHRINELGIRCIGFSDLVAR
jgi:predicted glycoside hydrolase/deacetylase ChbG (UPF0249 family)